MTALVLVFFGFFGAFGIASFAVMFAMMLPFIIVIVGLVLFYKFPVPTLGLGALAAAAWHLGFIAL
jgi:hypothetical protein